MDRYEQLDERRQELYRELSLVNEQQRAIYNAECAEKYGHLIGNWVKTPKKYWMLGSNRFSTPFYFLSSQNNGLFDGIEIMVSSNVVNIINRDKIQIVEVDDLKIVSQSVVDRFLKEQLKKQVISANQKEN